MKKLILIALTILITAWSDAQSLRVANQISIWLETQTGFDKYTAKYPRNPGYFLHFTSTDPADTAFGDLDEGLDNLQERITGIATTEKYGFAITQRVNGGKAGACYTYPDPMIQRDVIALEKSMISLATGWAADHSAKITSITYPNTYTPPDVEKYMIITIDVTPITSN